MCIGYKEITNQGSIYIVTVTIDNLLNRMPDTAREMQLMVKENDYNDYYISFQK